MNDLAKDIRAGYPRVWAALVEAHGPCAPEFEEGNQSWLMAAVADLFGDYSWDSIEAGLLRADEVLAERDRRGKEHVEDIQKAAELELASLNEWTDQKLSVERLRDGLGPTPDPVLPCNNGKK